MARPNERAQSAITPPTTDRRSSRERSHPRASPYPAPVRPLRPESSPCADTQRPAAPASTREYLPVYQLMVRPIVKATVAQRDSSGNTLDAAVIKGGSFNDIIQKLWDQFAPRVKCRAVKTDGVWSTELPNVAEWPKVMQFKMKKHIVPATKSEQAWNQWLVKTHGETVTLLIYEYGVAITRAEDLDAFKEARIRPKHINRAGATAEVSMREIVTSLQEKWGTTLQGQAVVWRMWGNHITRNLKCSTLETAIAQAPPSYVANLLRPADSTLERHLSNLAQSANVALDCVRGSLADYQQLRRDWEAFGHRLDEHERHLETRMTIIEGVIRDIVHPSPSSAPDPLLQLENSPNHSRSANLVGTGNKRAH